MTIMSNYCQRWRRLRKGRGFKHGIENRKPYERVSECESGKLHYLYDVKRRIWTAWIKRRGKNDADADALYALTADRR